MVADSIRLSVTWDRPTDAPTTYVAKVPAAEETSRAAAAATRTYLIEAAFYNDLADSLSVNRPHCYLSLHDEATNDYVVLLDDLAPAEAGDQIAGCSVEDATRVIPELAALHAPRWEDPTLAKLTWLDAPSDEHTAGVGMLASMMFPTFLERYEHRLAPGVADLAKRFIGRLAEYLAHRPRPWTVVHGDFRLDNLLFGGARVAVLDWQTVRLGPAMSDVAYFIGSALQRDDRRANEEALVHQYHDALCAAGVDFSWDDCWYGYRRHGYDGLLMAILASMLVGRTDRGDDMFMAMANRHGEQLLDLDGEALLAGVR
jgi:Phosphotransferase enzyme family